MKNLFYILLLFSFSIQSQELIKGKLFTSESFKNTFSDVYVKTKNSSNKILIDKEGVFNIQIENNKDNYILEFYQNNQLIKTYDFKKEWIIRKHPKSISLTENCGINTSKAISDWKSNKAKLYVYQSTELEETDLKNQENFEYVLIKNIDIKNFDCYLKYNKRILTYLKFKNNLIFKKINNNTIGFKEYEYVNCKL